MGNAIFYWKVKHRLRTTRQYTGVPNHLQVESKTWKHTGVTSPKSHRWNYKEGKMASSCMIIQESFLKKKGKFEQNSNLYVKAACMFTSCLCLLAATNPRKKATLPVACCHLLRKDQEEAQKAFSVPLEGRRESERTLVVVQMRARAHTHTLILTGKLPTTALENAVTWPRTGQGRKLQIRPSRSLILSNPLTSLSLAFDPTLSFTHSAVFPWRDV